MFRRKQDGAGVEDTVVGFEQTVAVHAEKRDAIAGFDAGGAQRAREKSGTMGESLVGESQIAANDGGPPGNCASA